MKKNKAMRFASGLLVLTLLTTCVISGTFAKYTTQDAGDDAARVAKWGVALQVEGSLYGEKYSSTTSLPVKSVVAPDSISVASSESTKKVLAPGTKSDGGLTYSLTGTPEVASQATAVIKTQNIYLKAGSYGVMVKVPAGTVTAENFKTDSYYTVADGKYTLATAFAADAVYYTLEDAVTVAADYYPVLYKQTGNTTSEGTVAEDTLAKLGVKVATQFNAAKDAVKTELDNATGVTTYTVTTETIAPNTDLATQFKLDNPAISWEWKLCNDAAAETTTGDKAGDNCKADTILGNLMAAAPAGTVVKAAADGSYAAPTAITDYCLDTQFSIDITVDQVD